MLVCSFALLHVTTPQGCQPASLPACPSACLPACHCVREDHKIVNYTNAISISTPMQKEARRAFLLPDRICPLPKKIVIRRSGGSQILFIEEKCFVAPLLQLSGLCRVQDREGSVDLLALLIALAIHMLHFLRPPQLLRSVQHVQNDPPIPPQYGTQDGATQLIRLWFPYVQV